MMSKALGAMLILGVGSYMGYALFLRYQNRIKNLDGFLTALRMLTAHMGFCAGWLSDIFFEISKAPLGTVSQVFLEAYTRCEKGEMPSGALWHAVETHQKKLSFLKEDKMILKEWLETLGKSDTAQEVRYIKATEDLLRCQKEKAALRAQKEGKLSAGFCMIGSLFLVILFW